jgi:hypothetical protein
MTTYYPEDVEIEAYLSAVWTDISAYVIGDIVCEGYGILTDSDIDRTAGVGSLSLTLKNTAFTFNPEGSGTPLAGFSRGTFVRVRVTYDGTPKTIFYGRVDRFQQSELPHGPRSIEVTIVDFMDDAGLFPLKDITVGASQRIEQAVASILAIMPIQPTGTDYSVGAYTFERVFDNIALNTRSVSEFDKLALSEMSYIYVRGDGRLVVESRNDRTGLAELSVIPALASASRFIVTEDDRFIIAEDGRFLVAEDSQSPEFTALINANPFYGDDLINTVIARAFTKTLDDALVNLIEVSTVNGWYKYIPVGVTKTWEIKYTDPNNRKQKINGYNMVTPVASTDYEAFANSDGTGTDHTNNITLTVEYLSNSARYAVSTETAACYVTFLQARGNGIYTYVPDENIVEDSVSIAQYGTREMVLDQKYQLSLIPGTAEAESIVDLLKDPSPKLKAVHFNANTSTQHMLAFLYYRVGDLVHISNTETGVDLYHWIQNIRWRITPGGVIDFWWGLKEHYSFKKGLSAIAVKYSKVAAGDEQNDLYFSPSPFVDDLAPMAVSYWVYMISILHESAISKTLRDVSDEAIAGFYVYTEGGGDVHLFAAFSGAEAHWETTDTPLAGLTDQWIHIAVSYDHSSAANNPLIFVNGVSHAVTETVSPSGTYVSDEGIDLHVGQIPSVTQYPTRLNGYYKDTRLYSKLITEAESLLLYQNENDYDYFTTGLVFQGFAVKTSKIDDYIGETLEANMKMRDNIYGLVGTPHYNSAVTGAEMEGASIYYPLENALAAGKYDDRYFDAAWAHGTERTYPVGYLNTQTESVDTPIVYLHFQFDGSSFDVGYIGWNDCSELHIVIDGGTQTDVNTNLGSATKTAEVWSSGDLGAGLHTVKIWGGGGGGEYILLDYIEIFA